uniref:Acyl-coenzyme A thioesterase 1-like n=1 Tax=Geotrypetes seraphini TaxID=260995 RepID=A0A6P8RNW0_GEOSA|nr:acyl-coenzyme A thioesterase 1-like [Geotrypetes seraphini]
MAAALSISPSPRCLFDAPVRVQVSGLAPLQEVTLRASLTDEGGELFQSSARYRAESNGELDLSRSPALGGSYSGVEPMGWLWALTPSKPFKRLVKRDVLSPFCLQLEVFEGHGAPGKLLCKGTNERSFLREGASRIPVREGRVRATLFLPPGPGPFPAVIDLYGTAGGLIEYRASLLANKGFVTLALAYFGFEDLPAGLEEFQLDYFQEAVEFLQTQQLVRLSGIGVLGISKGADLALSLASFLSGIKAAVSISGCGVNSFAALRCNDFTIPGLSFSVDRMKFLESGAADMSEILDDPLDPAHKNSWIPVEKSSAAFLFLSGSDDKNWKSVPYCQEVVTRLQAHGRDVEFYCYPGAGHLLEPPYFPLCQASFHKLLGMPLLWGGKWKEQAQAQDDAWHRIQTFLHKHLSSSNPHRSHL